MVLDLENIEKVKRQIREVLDRKVRPYLHIDKGDLELLDVGQDGIATIRFHGSCFECPLKPMTMRGGVERVIMQNVPFIRRIEEG
jgi:Fe/S biogenesis protein NfuA